MRKDVTWRATERPIRRRAQPACSRILGRRARIAATVPAELRHPALYLSLPLSDRALPFIRRGAAFTSRPVAGVTATSKLLPARPGHPPVRVWLYEPAQRTRPSGVVVYLHGGGFVMGSATAYHDTCSRLAADLGALVVSVDYRLAPENPAPAAVEDCYTALACVHARADLLGVDPRRIALAGDSAGGGLAACLAQLAHDRAEVPVAFHALIYPMLDDRTVLRVDDAGTGAFIWTPRANRFGWTAYLGHPPSDAASPYAAAARREDLAGLPPAWIGVGDLDLFHAEDVDYAERLITAGVGCEPYVVPGMYHGADRLCPTAASMRAFRASWTRALASGLSA